MSLLSIRRSAPLLVCLLAAIPAIAQEAPAMPPSLDQDFWGRTNAPYILKLTQTTTKIDNGNKPQTHVSEINVYRDSVGRVRTEDFYDNGQPKTAVIVEPNKSTMTLLTAARKSATVLHTPPPPTFPSKTWTVERLPSRVIYGFPAEGFRFTRTISAYLTANGAPDKVIDEEWVSRALSVVLEQKTESQLNGTTTKTVAQFKQTNPDPSLFSIPADYTVQKSGAPAQ